MKKKTLDLLKKKFSLNFFEVPNYSFELNVCLSVRLFVCPMKNISFNLFFLPKIFFNLFFSPKNFFFVKNFFFLKIFQNSQIFQFFKCFHFFLIYQMFSMLCFHVYQMLCFHFFQFFSNVRKHFLKKICAESWSDVLHSIRKIHYSRSETKLISQIQKFKIRFKKTFRTLLSIYVKTIVPEAFFQLENFS